MAHHNPASIAADEIAEFSSEDLMKKSCPKRSKLKKFQNLCKKTHWSCNLHCEGHGPPPNGRRPGKCC